MEEQSSKEFIEFEEINDEFGSEAVVRKSFRIPVAGKAGFTLINEGQTYPVANISASGLGVLTNPDSTLFLGQILNDCELILLKESIKGLKGEIVHCSPDISGMRMCGIRWLNSDENDFTKIKSVLLTLKKELFGKNQSEE